MYKMGLTLLYSQSTPIAFTDVKIEFEHKVILITGASSGIGEACALQFTKAGGLLSLVGRNKDNLKRVARTCARLSSKEPLTIIGDISVTKDVEKIVHETITHYGKIDVLVNNAGILLFGDISDDISILDKLIATNVRGTYLLSQKCIPHLIETKGNIVIVSSVVSSLSEPLMTAYTMTKAALDALMRCMADKLGPKDVRVNSVNPGPTFTKLFITSGLTDSENQTKFEESTQCSPLKKITESDDVAHLITFLASDKAKCITGSFNFVDGGIQLGVPIVNV